MRRAQRDRHEHARVQLLGLAAALITLSPASLAFACSTIAPPPSLNGVPSDGDRDVPTDVVPYYRYPIGAGPGTVASSDPNAAPPIPGAYTLTASDGTTIRLTAQLGSNGDLWNFALQPEHALAPNTEYVLRAAWTAIPSSGLQAGVAQVRFTTGPGPLAAPPAPPVARLTHYQLSSDSLTSCSPPANGTCISVANDSAVIIATYIDTFNQQQDTYGTRGSSFGDNLSGINPGTPNTCVQLRTRALNSKLSEPTKLCGADYKLVQIDSTDRIECTSAGILAKGTVAAPNADAGSAVPPPATPDAGTAGPGATPATPNTGAAGAAVSPSKPDASVADAAAPPSAGRSATSAAAGAGGGTDLTLTTPAQAQAGGCTAVTGPHRSTLEVFIALAAFAALVLRRRARSPEHADA